MAGRDNFYSRLVFWLKILLPLAALVILSTMFLIARTIDPSRAIRFAKMDVTRMAAESRVSGPIYSGVTSDGGTLQVTAAEAMPQPSNPGHASATGLVAHLVSRSGQLTTMTADHGQLDQPANRATFDGHVTIDAMGGYRMVAPHMVSTLDRTDMLATGGVHGSGPFGTIVSDQARMTPDADQPGSYVTVFKGKVKLVYQPGQKG